MEKKEAANWKEKVGLMEVDRDAALLRQPKFNKPSPVKPHKK